VAKRKADEGAHNPAEKERPRKTATKKVATKAAAGATAQAARTPAAGGRIRVRQVRSLSGRPDKHRRTIEALGLKYTQHAVEHTDTPAIRGMIQQVVHLVSVEPVE
jgi:large subunit ribosomal protein L30